MADDEFEPKLGRMRSGGKGRKYLHRVLAATNLARGGSAGRSRQPGFSGSRIGRGAGVGRLLGARTQRGGLTGRRVIVKSRIVRLAGKGLAGCGAHLRYIQRDGTTREGTPGELYDAASDRSDGSAFLERSSGDRHQFRFIVSAEDGAEYEDLKPLTRRLMSRMEEDLGTRLEWVAVDHYNTGHPHTHVLLRGKDDLGGDLVIARDYIKHGMRERASELVDLDLGPRTAREIERRLETEVDQERLTSIDRALLRDATDGLASASGRNKFDQSIRMGRLRKLERLGLATNVSGPIWRLSPVLSETLARMGERGDIIRTMQRALAKKGRDPAAAARAIYDPRTDGSRPLVGRLVERGLSDEIDDRHYLIVEATDGRTHYVDIGKADAAGPIGDGAIVRIEPTPAGLREVDRTVAAVAAANGGRYDVELHLTYDPAATEEFAEAHVRRLEAIRRLTGGAQRQSDGSWLIAPDHLKRAEAYEAIRSRDRPVAVTLFSPQPLEKLAGVDAATWLDRELVSETPQPLRDVGFGREVSAALASRRQWLVSQGLADEHNGRTDYRPDLVDILRRRELLRIAGDLANEVDLPFGEAKAGDYIEGRLLRSVDLVSGRHALIERTRDFILVPWRPVMDRQLGKELRGVMRRDGISWSLGRSRTGPNIS